jgi:nucleoside phosphorylase
MATKFDLASINGKIDFGIITIREDEFRAVLLRFPKYAETEGNRRYAISAIQTNEGDHHLVAIVRCPEQGGGEGQNVTRDIISDLDPNWLLLVGIAGGVPNYEFTLGDVIVATRLHDFSVGADIESRGTEYGIRGGPMHPVITDLLGHLPSMDSELGPWNSMESVETPRPSVDLRLSNFYGDDEWKHDTRKILEKHFGKTALARAPKVVTGSIAASDRLIKSTKTIATWRTTARQIQAVEMELAGVYQAARRKNREYPILAIRGISDIVGLKRQADWTGYACHTAASFAHALLRTRLVEPRDSSFAKKVISINIDTVKPERSSEVIGKCLDSLSIDQATQLLVQAKALAEKAYNNFDLTYTPPADCDLVYDTLIQLWNDYLSRLFTILDNTLKVPQELYSLKAQNRVVAGMIERDVNWIIGKIPEFRPVCLENDSDTKRTRQKIYQRIEKLYNQLEKMVDDLTGTSP